MGDPVGPDDALDGLIPTLGQINAAHAALDVLLIALHSPIVPTHLEWLERFEIPEPVRDLITSQARLSALLMREVNHQPTRHETLLASERVVAVLRGQAQTRSDIEAIRAGLFTAEGGPDGA